MIPLFHLVGPTLNVAGEILIAYTVLRVHSRVIKEHRIDKAVFSEMRKEQVLGVLGIILIVIGYLLEVINIYFI